MNLKPIEQVKFDAIKTVVQALKSAGMDESLIATSVAAQVAEFEATTRYVVKIHATAQEDGQFITLIDTKKDFVRARLSGETGQALRCKVFNIPIDIKVAKTGEYEFTNEQIADALIELAKTVLKLDTQVKIAGNLDFNADGTAKSGAQETENDPETDTPDAQNATDQDDQDNAVHKPQDDESPVEQA